MKTKKQVIEEHPEYKGMIDAIFRNIGIRSVEEINKHGAEAGFDGFTYYHETHHFAMKHRDQIISLLEETAEQLGEEVISLVKSFRVFNGKMDADDLKDLYKYLGGGRPAQGTITNVMAWFALEEVCRWFDD